VLDYGCGTGIITNQIATQVREIHGIDISLKSIDMAAKKASVSHAENVRYTHTDILGDRLQAGSYDCILSFSVLHLIRNPVQVIKKVHELLVPEGLFISATPCLGENKSILGISLLLLSRMRLMPYIAKYKAGDLVNLIADAGFQIIQTDTIKSITTNGFIVARKI
jgi:2-polyprenyl-3-methyl-5-hydroxy-6-metoxy-1,4-benzoquinol methylase